MPATQKGFGADCVSGNEVIKSIEVGFPAEQITFAGVGKSDKEIKAALQYQIFAFNVTTPKHIAQIAEASKVRIFESRIIYEIIENIHSEKEGK